MTPLGERLLGRIAADGPITVEDYMAACLLDPEHGYYATRDPLGAAGDFITAPEVSQMFGELVGLALAQAWLDQGAPAPVALAELGPGRGTLMADALRATRGVPGFHDALALHLVEASPRLREAQAERLPAAAWHDDVDDLPKDRPLLLVANEFLDALPIRQFVRAGEGWAERVVAAEDGRLSFALGPPAPVPALAHRGDDVEEGQVVELRPEAERVAAALGRRVAAGGGLALLIDYGDRRSIADTLQAVKGHAPADPLEAPGEADLSAHVDFEAVAAAAAPARATRPIPQGLFLERLGIAHRADRLARSLEGDALAQHLAARRRLTHPEEMGTLFKVMALVPPDAPPPPGFPE